MRHALLTLAALGASAVPAGAETVFVGDTLVLSVTEPCGTSVSVGETARFTYRPGGGAFQNGADSYLAYVPNRSSYAMTVPNNTFRAGVNYAGQALGSQLTLKTGTGGVIRWEQDPAALTPNASSASLVATFANYWAVQGCTVTIRSHLLRVKSNEGERID